jgi:DNA-binding response OmpR family regulator
MRSKLLKKLKILFVEDEEKIALLIKEAIGGYFYRFLVAKDGIEALKFYHKFVPDIVIADINMPFLNGLDMAKEIRKENKEIPIIILSAFSEKEKLFKAIDIGINKYFLKPYDPDALLDYIEQLAPMLEEKTVMLCGGFVFNKITNALYKNNKYIALSKNEIKFLLLLIKYKNNVVTYDMIKQTLWGIDATDERLRTFVRRLRLKTSKKLFENVKSLGYKLP